jgi:hypothetical protein
MKTIKYNKTTRNKTIRNKTKHIKQTYAVVQYDNRKLNNHFKILTKINKKYCSLYGYDYIFETKEYNLSPYWIKVKLVQDLLNTNKYKGILWLDTDAVIDDFSIGLDSISKPNKSIYFSNELVTLTDSKDRFKDRNKYRFNSGVWFVLNNNIGKLIINDWFNLYDSNNWFKIRNKWVCKDKIIDKNCKWAGKDYEQGAFTDYILPKYEKDCYQYFYNFFQSTNIKEIHIDNPTFVYHFYGYKTFNKPFLIDYLKTKELTIKSLL